MSFLARGAGTLLRTLPRVPTVTLTRNAWVFERHYPLKNTSDPHPDPRYQDNLLRHLPEDMEMTYKEVEEYQPEEPVKVILLKNTDDFGDRGQVVTVEDPRWARDELLLPGLAVYATEANLEKYKDILISEDNFKFSSPTIKEFLPFFSRLVVPVTMNLHEDWTLSAANLRVCFHRVGVNVEESAIEMPPGEIRGPDLALQNREFYVWVTVNGFERVPIRCVLNHWSPDPEQDAALRTVGWQHRFHEPVFEEDREFLASMKRMRYGKFSASREDNREDLEKYRRWKGRRDEQLQGPRPEGFRRGPEEDRS